jgi:hypothetical protein
MQNLLLPAGPSGGFFLIEARAWYADAHGVESVRASLVTRAPPPAIAICR